MFDSTCSATEVPAASSRPEPVTAFAFDDYKTFLRAFLARLPRRGRGLRTRISETLRIPLSTVSEVFGAERHFTPEQAAEVGYYLGLRGDELDFFLVLVEKERAGTQRLRQCCEARLQKLRAISPRSP